MCSVFLLRSNFVKPAIHYSRTWRTGDKTIFSPNKILLAKTRRTCCCTLFVVYCQFSRSRWFFFFNEKILCIRRRDCYPDANPAYSVWWKTWLQNMVNVFYTLFTVHRFFVVSPLFRCCLQIVYSGLKSYVFHGSSFCLWSRCGPSLDSSVDNFVVLNTLNPLILRWVVAVHFIPFRGVKLFCSCLNSLINSC